MYWARRKITGLCGVLTLFVVASIWLGGGYNFNKSDITNRTMVTKLNKADSTTRTKINKHTQCTRRTNIAFLKVHKCGSTTMSNILHRFALRYNLNVVLPNTNGTQEHFWVLGTLDENTTKEIIPVARGEEYNILAVDTYYNKRIYKQLIPIHPFFLAILREPVERYISFLFYFGKISPTMKQQMKTDPYIFRNYTNKAFSVLDDFSFHLQNLNLNRFTERMDNEFDMIMVTEYFDQSLILLKRKLCWTFQDIIYITSNINFQNKGYAVSPNDRQNMITRNINDSIFYEHFKSKLFKECNHFGVEFLEELHQFKMVLKLVRDYCTFVKKGDNALVIPESPWNQPFIVDPNECFLMKLREFPLVKMLQERQRNLYFDCSNKKVV